MCSASRSNVYDDSSTTTALRWSTIGSVIDATPNAEIPFSTDDRNLWVGRGISSRLTIEVRANLGPLCLQARERSSQRFGSALVLVVVAALTRSFRPTNHDP